jgi:hypothetical protein
VKRTLVISLVLATVLVLAPAAVGHSAQQPFGDAWLRHEIVLSPSHSVLAGLDNQYGVTGATMKALDPDPYDLQLPNLGNDVHWQLPNAYAAS